MNDDDTDAALAYQEQCEREHYERTCNDCGMYWAVSDSELCGSCGGELNVRDEHGAD